MRESRTSGSVRGAGRNVRLYRDSKIKSILRTIAARTREALDDGITYALNAVTPSDVRGWFEHSGCPIPAT